ncbi:hypothetical protein WKI68_11350 [Streptomyces sp. MS1.HAVA.3]|uniref:Xaa-Pro dipeptidyl-peptidase-like domain-containing protein n=1 Tax=Streptomyces caledonius TaxID=3134107 RepID=A0ABU8U237_9ACTN
MDSYGGPCAQDVSAEPRRWQARQWWADQGFAVVTVDNRGTANVSPPTRTPCTAASPTSPSTTR